MIPNLKEWLAANYPVICKKVVKRIDGEVREGEVKMYWAGNIIRIDINPKGEGNE